jgi:hypothetical protein
MTGAAGSKPRGFLLTVRPASDEAYGLRLEETNGAGRDARLPVVSLGARASHRVVEQAMDALQASGFRRSDLSPRRRKPFHLPDQHGVRLALVMVASGPLQKRTRVEAVLNGVGRMSDEEALYWYAKCLGDGGSRSRRALRLMLADD